MRVPFSWSSVIVVPAALARTCSTHSTEPVAPRTKRAQESTTATAARRRGWRAAGGSHQAAATARANARALPDPAANRHVEVHDPGPLVGLPEGHTTPDLLDQESHSRLVILKVTMISIDHRDVRLRSCGSCLRNRSQTAAVAAAQLRRRRGSGFRSPASPPSLSFGSSSILRLMPTHSLANGGGGSFRSPASPPLPLLRLVEYPAARAYALARKRRRRRQLGCAVMKHRLSLARLAPLPLLWLDVRPLVRPLFVYDFALRCRLALVAVNAHQQRDVQERDIVMYMGGGLGELVHLARQCSPAREGFAVAHGPCPSSSPPLLMAPGQAASSHSRVG